MHVKQICVCITRATVPSLETLSDCVHYASKDLACEV